MTADSTASPSSSPIPGPGPTPVELEQSIEISAPPARVWELVSDLRRMASWSPQVVRTFVRGGGPVALGTRTVNINRRGLLCWPTQAKVVRFEPNREIAFRVKDNYTIWSFTLEPSEVGTRVVQRREVPDGISDISVRVTKLALGGAEKFAAELSEGMRMTLLRLKVDAER